VFPYLLQGIGIAATNYTGLVVIDGKLIEKPVLRDMHRIVAIADIMGV